MRAALPQALTVGLSFAWARVHASFGEPLWDGPAGRTVLDGEPRVNHSGTDHKKEVAPSCGRLGLAGGSCSADGSGIPMELTTRRAAGEPGASTCGLDCGGGSKALAQGSNCEPWHPTEASRLKGVACLNPTEASA